jgi:hypothetical protein
MTCFLLIQGNPVEHIELLTKIKAEISCFNSTYDVQRFEELLRLKEYLHYRIRTREYEANLAAAHGNIAELCSTYVNGKLAKYDNAEKNRVEQEKWGWSPIYRILKEWPLSNFPSSPWSHTQEEWVEIERTLLENVSTEPLSLELECPHIVRAFLIVFRQLHGHSRPLSHPDAGLTLQYILDFAVDTEKSVSLTNVVHNLEASGWNLFPIIHSVVDSFSNLHSDTVALLGYDPEKQVAVVEKIRSFVGRVAHRAISDMVRMQRSSELEDMWFMDDVSEQRRTKCNEV